MHKKNILLFVLIYITLASCSFDSKTGIWSGGKEEKERIAELERQQKQVIDVVKIYSSDNIFNSEISLNKNITLTSPKKNSSWKTPSLNNQNFIGNLYLQGINNLFLKKKVGKNKYFLSKVASSPLVFNNYIFFSDTSGTIFKITQTGKIVWKKNIYKKIYKKIHKKLAFSIYKNIIYISDNIGFVYAVNIENGEILWIKNYEVPFKSNIKLFKDKIYLINQDNRIFCLKISDGSKSWNIRSISSFIKSQGFLSLAVSKSGNLYVINTSGDLIKIDSKSGSINWSLNVSGSLLAHATDFFQSSEIVLDNENIFFSTNTSFYSYNTNSAALNWENDLSTNGTPVIDKNNIFIVTKNGFFVIINKNNGKILSSENILKILKKKKKKTHIAGFVMASGKIYSVTANGFLIVSSATTGKVQSFKKIGDEMVSTPIISDGKLYLLTKNSKILGYN